MVAARVFSPDGRSTNVGVYHDIPTGTLSLGTMVEMGNADARAFGGSVYVSSRESGTVTRYDVTDEPRLVESETISFRELRRRLLGADVHFVFAGVHADRGYCRRLESNDYGDNQRVPCHASGKGGP